MPARQQVPPGRPRARRSEPPANSAFVRASAADLEALRQRLRAILAKSTASNAMAGLAGRIGIAEATLRTFISGSRQPFARTVGRIRRFLERRP